MTRNQGTATVVILYAILLVLLQLLAHSLINHDEQNQVKIECFLHRDNPDVHKLCIDHGYDRQ